MENEIKTKILEESRRHFAQSGYSKTSLEKIAADCNISKKQIAQHFGNKEDLLIKIIEHETAIAKYKIYEAITTTNDPLLKLRNFTKAKINALSEIQEFYSTLLQDESIVKKFIIKTKQDFYNEETEIISTILKYGIQHGTFKIKDVSSTSRAIVTAIKGLTIPFPAVENIVDNLNKQIDELIDLIFKGIAKTKV